jgi:hypothetical protein
MARGQADYCFILAKVWGLGVWFQSLHQATDCALAACMANIL